MVLSAVGHAAANRNPVLEGGAHRWQRRADPLRAHRVGADQARPLLLDGPDRKLGRLSADCHLGVEKLRREGTARDDRGGAGDAVAEYLTWAGTLRRSDKNISQYHCCLLYTSPSPRDGL